MGLLSFLNNIYCKSLGKFTHQHDLKIFTFFVLVGLIFIKKYSAYELYKLKSHWTLAEYFVYFPESNQDFFHEFNWIMKTLKLHLHYGNVLVDVTVSHIYF